MARVPVVESPCPIAGKGLPAGSTEHCTLCDRSVHNLDLMNERERREFMGSCSGKVCVAYTVRIPAARIPVRHRGLGVAALAAVAVASIAALPAAADSSSENSEAPSDAMSPLPGSAAQYPNCDSYLEEVIVGGVSHGDQAEWADDGKDAPPDLPTMEDDGR